jgi:hypothetical protein
VNEKLVSSIDKILGLNTTAVVALGGLVLSVLYAGWVIGSLYNDIRHISDEQTSERLCARISECPVCDKLLSFVDDYRVSNSEVKIHRESDAKEFREMQRRLLDLEQRTYELSTKSSARPDPFTGTMGRAMEERIHALEQKK